VLVLRVPADDRMPVGLVRVAASAVTFSDAIGGGFLDEALDARADGREYVVLLDERRVPKGLPSNQRAAVLAARLGHVNRQWLADLRGDALIVGVGRSGSDADVPDGVIDAAARSGLLPKYDRPGSSVWRRVLAAHADQGACGSGPSSWTCGGVRSRGCTGWWSTCAPGRPSPWSSRTRPPHPRRVSDRRRPAHRATVPARPGADR
jgi:hypothetical protein